MNDKVSLEEINKRLKKHGLKLGDPRPLLDEWFVLYKLESSEVVDGVPIREWTRLCKLYK